MKNNKKRSPSLLSAIAGEAYVSSRQPTNEVMELQRQKLTFLCSPLSMTQLNILIEDTSGAMKLRDAANDKTLTQELEKVWCE